MAKKKTSYLALLRGINVGGNNIISKGDLAACFEDCGFEDVATYIQSGNIVFRSGTSSIKRLTSTVEKALTERFDYAARAVILSRQQYDDAVNCAHRGWGKKEDQKHNALFTFPETSPEEVMAELPPLAKRIEKVSTATGAIFWSYSKAEINKTTMMKLAKNQVYKLVTIRNHNTTFKLQSMLGQLDSSS